MDALIFAFQPADGTEQRHQVAVGADLEAGFAAERLVIELGQQRHGHADAAGSELQRVHLRALHASALANRGGEKLGVADLFDSLRCG